MIPGRPQTREFAVPFVLTEKGEAATGGPVQHRRSPGSRPSLCPCVQCAAKRAGAIERVGRTFRGIGAAVTSGIQENA